MESRSYITEYVVRENVLTDNVLKVAPKSKVFKGGYLKADM